MFLYSLKKSQNFSRLSYLVLISPLIIVFLRSLKSDQSSTIIKTLSNSLNLNLDNIFLNLYLIS